MSIYATLWQLQFPRDGFLLEDSDWVTVIAQGVPSHIGTPSPGQGYEHGDPYAAHLPPAIPYDPEGGRMRAVVFVLLGSPKGTARSGQEHPNPLLVLTGDEYDRTSFAHLHGRICTALRELAGVLVAETIQLTNGRTLTIYRNGDASEADAALPP